MKNNRLNFYPGKYKLFQKDNVVVNKRKDNQNKQVILFTKNIYTVKPVYSGHTLERWTKVDVNKLSRKF
jgi:hypothetical protein